MMLAEIARELRDSLLRRDCDRLFCVDSLKKCIALPEFQRRLVGTEVTEAASRVFDLARVSMDYPFVASVVAQSIGCHLVREFHPQGEEWVKRFLPAIPVMAVANYEKGCREGLRAMTSRRMRDGLDARIEIRKPIVTNAPHADLALISFWDEFNESRRLRVAAWSRRSFVSRDLAADLDGFYTGSTGSVALSGNGLTPELEFAPDRTFEIFASCFDLERLLLSCATFGICAGLGVAIVPTDFCAAVPAEGADRNRHLSRLKVESARRLSSAAAHAGDDPIARKIRRDLKYLKLLGGAIEVHRKIAGICEDQPESGGHTSAA